MIGFSPHTLCFPALQACPKKPRVLCLARVGGGDSCTAGVYTASKPIGGMSTLTSSGGPQCLAHPVQQRLVSAM